MVFRQDVYALWAMLAGFVIGMDWVTESYQFYLLFLVILICRSISHRYNWSLPRRSLQSIQTDTSNNYTEKSAKIG